ncbi:MAG: phosphotransferase, partial [Alphaproteobacteria bacterium]|nr:phosphotransferase [Alphaproteobacteria bacterium]
EESTSQVFPQNPMYMMPPTSEPYIVKIEGLDLIKGRSPEPIVKAINTALKTELRSDQLDFGEYFCQIEAIPVSPRVFILNCSHGKKYSLRAMYVREASDRRNAIVRARAIMSHVNFSRLGISPKVFAYDVEHGILISEYIDNDPLKLKKFDDNLLKKLVILLKGIHGTAKLEYDNAYHKKEFSPYSFLKSSVERVISLYPKQLAWYKNTIFYMDLIYQILFPYFQNNLCHYEMHPLNLLCDKKTEELYIIDWETAFVGDPMFDLATISCLSNFDRSRDDLLLFSYYEHSLSEVELAHFFLMKQHVYLFFSLQMIKSYNDPTIYMSNKKRHALGILKPDTKFSHPLSNTPQGNYQYSILLANTALHNIHTHDFNHHLSVILFTHASNYIWFNQLNLNPDIPLWLLEYAKKVNEKSAIVMQRFPAKFGIESCVSYNQVLSRIHDVFFPGMLALQQRLTPRRFLPTISGKVEYISQIPNTPQLLLDDKQQLYMFVLQVNETYLGRKWLEKVFANMERIGILSNLVWKKHQDRTSYTLHSASLSKNKTFEDAITYSLFDSRRGSTISDEMKPEKNKSEQEEFRSGLMLSRDVRPVFKIDPGYFSIIRRVSAAPDPLIEKLKNTIPSNPDVSDLDFPCFAVDAGIIPPEYPQILVSGLAPGDGNCFFHSTITEEGEGYDSVTERANAMRRVAIAAVMRDARYQQIMKKELLVVRRLSEGRTDDIGDEELREVSEAEVSAVTEGELRAYLDNYLYQNRGPAYYIRFPNQIELPMTFANIIAELNGFQITVLAVSHSEPRKLIFVSRLGNDSAAKSYYIKLRNNHVVPLLNYSLEGEDRLKSILQTKRNYDEWNEGKA